MLLVTVLTPFITIYISQLRTQHFIKLSVKVSVAILYPQTPILSYPIHLPSNLVITLTLIGLCLICTPILTLVAYQDLNKRMFQQRQALSD